MTKDRRLGGRHPHAAEFMLRPPAPQRAGAMLAFWGNATLPAGHPLGPSVTDAAMVVTAQDVYRLALPMDGKDRTTPLSLDWSRGSDFGHHVALATQGFSSASLRLGELYGPVLNAGGRPLHTANVLTASLIRGYEQVATETLPPAAIPAAANWFNDIEVLISDVITTVSDPVPDWITHGSLTGSVPLWDGSVTPAGQYELRLLVISGNSSGGVPATSGVFGSAANQDRIYLCKVVANLSHDPSNPFSAPMLLQSTPLTLRIRFDWDAGPGGDYCPGYAIPDGVIPITNANGYQSWSVPTTPINQPWCYSGGHWRTGAAFGGATGTWSVSGVSSSAKQDGPQAASYDSLGLRYFEASDELVWVLRKRFSGLTRVRYRFVPTLSSWGLFTKSTLYQDGDANNKWTSIGTITSHGSGTGFLYLHERIDWEVDGVKVLVNGVAVHDDPAITAITRHSEGGFPSAGGKFSLGAPAPMKVVRGLRRVGHHGTDVGAPAQPGKGSFHFLYAQALPLAGGGFRIVASDQAGAAQADVPGSEPSQPFPSAQPFLVTRRSDGIQNDFTFSIPGRPPMTVPPITAGDSGLVEMWLSEQSGRVWIFNLPYLAWVVGLHEDKVLISVLADGTSYELYSGVSLPSELNGITEYVLVEAIRERDVTVMPIAGNAMGTVLVTFKGAATKHKDSAALVTPPQVSLSSPLHGFPKRRWQFI